MAIIEIVILVFVIGYRLLILVLSCFSLVDYRKRRGFHIPTKLQHHYVFLFPVFREHHIIEKTFLYYERFLRWFPQVEIIFVGTQKENNVPSTSDMLLKLIAKSLYKKRINCILCPSLDGTKATQVNFALDFIRSKYKETPYTVSFDCDARMRWQDFLLADQYISKHPEHAVYSFVPKMNGDQSSGPWIRALMFHHGERVLAFEYPSKFSLGLNYPMGATTVYSPKLWKFIKHIPEPNDDLSLKYVLDHHKRSYVSLPFFTYVEGPPNLKNLYRQMIPIFSGVFSFFRTLQSFNIPFTIKNIFIGCCLYVFYVLEYVSIIFFINALVSGHMLVLGLFAFQVMLDLIFYRKLSLSNFLLHCVGYLIRLSQFAYFLFYKLFGSTDLCQFKTERGVSKIKEKCVTMT
ncbi:MAG: hypothetical protein A2V81_03730 [Candidatus Abawacabacteria bacterium RBG_16_42_10]|uniref:Glycosyltransferase 2-like domain-containing protein n=1 Tax=Candidatus Abawacabacteria bacterium RBG_16_42_10 TaxID=1817814 RepID=A0A1F4XJU4_9BACT|nr:MAG: hypothetical protein A2V81_03730 [Candidatus Abawacabacteria bacterium RBG_16_42_10]